MAADTGQDLILAVQGNLGDRDTGTIGGLPVATVVLNALNRAQLRLAKLYNIETLQRNATIDISTSASEYASPILDVDSNTINIKDFLSVVLKQDDETTGVVLTRLAAQCFKFNFPITSADESGRPGYYSVFSTLVRFHPYPDDDYTAYCQVNVWPTKWESSTLTSSSPLGEEWDEVIEALATFFCFQKLQQVDDAAIWFSIYAEAAKATKRALRKKPDMKQSVVNSSRSHISNPTDNPFVRSY